MPANQIVDAESPLLETDDPLELLKKKQPAEWSVALMVCSLVSCLNAVQYGYHMSELNAPEHIIKQVLELSDSQIGLITSIFSVGGLISSTLASKLSTTYGLKMSFLITSVFYTIGSYIEAQADSYFWMMIGRFTSGVGAGFAIVFVPLYLNQISPLQLRGFLGSMNQVSVNGGILLTQVLAINWSNEETWRSILYTASVLGLISFISTLVFLDESPKWLVLNGGNDIRGFTVLMKFRNDNRVTCEEEIKIWKEEERKHLQLIAAKPHLKNLGFYHYLTDPNYQNSRMVACSSMLGQQFAGINAVVFYGVKILVGLFPDSAILLNCMISVINMFITFISSLFVDKLGRKPLLLISVGIMGIASIGLSAGVLFSQSALTVLSIFTYVGAFAIGTGPIPFLYVSEVSQVEVKDLAQSWATICNWSSVFVIGSVFPILVTSIGGYTYLIFAAVCFTFFAFAKREYPETKGKETYAEVWGLERD